MLPTVDLATTLKLFARNACRRLFKSGISLLLFLATLVASACTMFYGFFDVKILPLPSPSAFDFGGDMVGLSETMEYILAVDVAKDILSHAYAFADKFVVFSFSFIASSFLLIIAYNWSLAFKRDIEGMVSGM